MLRENKKVACVFWVLVVICMMVIFYFSSRTGDESAAQSGGILEWIKTVFGTNAVTDFIVRKSAHCLEFTGLSLLFNCALLFSNAATHPFQSVLFTSLYAVSDEIHQIFVPGRSCELRDWAIDTAGALIGSAAFMILVKIFTSVLKKRKSTVDTKTE